VPFGLLAAQKIIAFAANKKISGMLFRFCSVGYYLD
jgi:hypothetical protein